jgi:hypothetical protein
MFAEGVCALLRPAMDENAETFARLLATLFARYAHKKDPQDILNAFDEFTDPNHEDRQQRCIAVGFCREGDVVLFNHAAFERHLKLKRASVDNLFRALGYESHTGIRRLDTIRQMLPSLADHPDTRQWCVRVRKRIPAVAADTVEISGTSDEVSNGPLTAPQHYPLSIATLLNRPVLNLHRIA